MSVSPFSAAHRRYVKSLYKRMLENERNWVVRYDLWRARACVVRAEFERNRCVLRFLLLPSNIVVNSSGDGKERP
jgi:NADH dehydrogenase (ubiquinone) 1 beta subcomplex subunit 9